MARARSSIIRQFIIDNVAEHPVDIARITAEHFGITRQAVRRHLLTLVEDEILEAAGETKSRRYSLVTKTHTWTFPLAEHRDEEKIWWSHVNPLVKDFAEDVVKICHYGFTEMYNNAVDHSGGSWVALMVNVSAKDVTIVVQDDGVGIFEKIRLAFSLDDLRQSILELAKGKLTTDPNHHSGQGIFFTSRAFDTFTLLSSHLAYVHASDTEDYLVERDSTLALGTSVRMTISAYSDRTLREVFDRYTNLADEDFPFSKTHVPLRLARYGDEQLVSRSQAKRVLARFDRFEEVMLDFAGIDEIGQAFADEIFRVFERAHPQIAIIAINTNEAIDRMIRRARTTPPEPSGPT